MTRRHVAIAGALLLTMAASAGFVAAYAAGGDRLYEGLSLAAACLGLCLAAIGWAFWVVPDEQVVDEIDDYPSPPLDRVTEIAEVRADIEKVSRPRWLIAVLGAALGSFGLALLVPIRSLGPRVDDVLFHTRWRKGIPLTRMDGTVVRAGELNVDSDEIVFPQDAIGDAMSQATLIRVPPGEAPTSQGYMVYSRVCTHAGCPVALYRAADKQLMCPCHQSVFDVMRDGDVVSGPADHALPRLPIEVGDDGVLRATGDFPQPVGPGFWERG